jgi:hypothetical protein
MQLLANGGLGRLVYNSRYGPTALPTVYRIDGESIVLGTWDPALFDEDLRTGIAHAEYKVAVEADQIDLGAREGQKQPSRPSTPGGDLSRFSALALPLLDALSAIHHPAVTHHIVETIDHIGAAQPKRAFLIAVNAATTDPAYPREIVALDATMQLIQHYTADHRDLVLSDPQYTMAVRALLEAFIRLGWDKATKLAEEPDELFT